MAPRLKPALLLGTLCAVVSACGSSATTDVTAPSNARCQPSVRGSATTFGPAGGSGSITIGVERECSWSASSLASWLEITSAREGQGEGTVNFRVAENGDPVSRRGSLQINEQRLDVSQDAAPCRFDVGATPPTVAAAGGQVPVSVAAHTACTWTAASQAPFATVAPASASGSATVQVTIAANSGAARTVSLVIAGQQRSITQDALAAPPSPPPSPAPPPQPPSPPPIPPSDCTVTVSPAERSFTFIGGNGSFQVSGPSTCAWTASSSASWISLTAASGTGNGEVRYVVLPNSSSSRQGTITVRGATHRVTQSALPTGNQKLEGPVSGLSGSCPTRRFTVEGVVVRTDGSTEFRKGNCNQLRNGINVMVEGTFQLDGTLLARRVEFD